MIISRGLAGAQLIALSKPFSLAHPSMENYVSILVEHLVGIRCANLVLTLMVNVAHQFPLFRIFYAAATIW